MGILHIYNLLNAKANTWIPPTGDSDNPRTTNWIELLRDGQLPKEFAVDHTNKPSLHVHHIVVSSDLKRKYSREAIGMMVFSILTRQTTTHERL